MKKQYILKILGLILIIFLVVGCTETSNNTNNDGNNENGDNQEEPNGETNLIAHWKFDEESGTTASDSAGSYTGTIHGDATWSEGYIGNALYFDGVDDYVSLSSEAVTDIGNLEQGTISFWFNYGSILDEQTIMPIFYIGIDSTDDDDSIFIIEIGHSDTESETLTVDPDNKKLYVTWTDYLQNQMEPILCYDSNQNIEENSWYHFAVVVGPDGNTGYLNGIELEDRYYNFGSSSDQVFLADIPTKEICTIAYGKTHEIISPDFVYYKGYIDDLRIYNEQLSESDIQNLFNET